MARLADHPLIRMVLARIVEFFREPGSLFWTFGFPVVLAVVLGIAFRERPAERFRVGLVDNGPVARQTLALLSHGSVVEATVMPESQALAELRRDKIDLIVRAEGAPTVLARIRYQYDSQRAESRAARLATDDALQRALGRADRVGSSDLPVHGPGSRYIDFLIPGLIGLNVLGSALWGVGYTVVLERRRRLLRRFVVTPMHRSYYLLSYMLSRLLFLVIEVAALLVFGWLVFDVAVQGSILNVALLALLGGLSFVGLALLVAARPDSTEVAAGLMNAVMLPTWLLSGSFFSYERFPEVFHPFIRALPLTAFNDAMRAVMNEGADLAAILPQLAVLLAWGLLTFVLALRFFRWQ